MFVVKILYPEIKCNCSARDIVVLCCFQCVRLMVAYENSEKSHDNILIVMDRRMYSLITR